MFKLSEIKELIKLVDQCSVQELEIENEGARLSIRKPSKTEPVYVTAAVQPHMIRSVQQVLLTRSSCVQSKPLHRTTGHTKQEDSSLHKNRITDGRNFLQSASRRSGSFRECW